VALPVLVPGCGKHDSTTGVKTVEAQPWLEDITERAGIRFKHEVGPGGKFFMPETVGSGAALFDYDNDGRLDIYLIQNAGPASKAVNKLFHQGADGRFTDVSAGSGLDVAGFGMGVAAGDINNDGFTDLLVTEYERVRLFLNQGNGTFREITKIGRASCRERV